jgi:hypothetical protein
MAAITSTLQLGLLLGSVVVAVAAFSLPFVFGPGYDPDVRAGLPFSLLWAATAVVGFLWVKHVRWWFFLGAPAALFWPAMYALLFVGCSIDSGQCP